MSIQSYAAQSLPQLWLSGFNTVLNFSSPNNSIVISAGICRDSNNVMDICLGTANFEGQVTSDPLILSSLAKGANGLDRGAIAVSSMYNIYVIADSSYQRQTASLLSLCSDPIPTMPAGYDSYRLIGFVATDASAHFIHFVQKGDFNDRTFYYNNALANIALNAAASTTPIGVNLQAFVPWHPSCCVLLNYVFGSTATGHIGSLLTYGSSSAMFTVGGDTLINGQTIFPLSLDPTTTPANQPKIAYSTTSGTADSFTLIVAGFTASL